MSDDPEIITQLRKARMAHRNAVLALDEAKAIVRKTKQTIEDILREVDTGRALINGRSAPLLDAIERKQAAPEPEPEPLREITWTSVDLERVLKAACVDPADPNMGVWEDMKQMGCDDSRILNILRAIWPMTALFVPTPTPGCSIRGGSTPAFWMGSRRPHERQATLAGLELADRIRRVLEIPRAHVDNSPTAEIPRKITRRRRTADDPTRRDASNVG